MALVELTFSWEKRELTIKKKLDSSDKCYEKEEGIESTRVEGEIFMWSGWRSPWQYLKKPEGSEEIASE